MKFKSLIITIVLTAGITGGIMFMLLGNPRGMSPDAMAPSGDSAPAAERKIIYWKAPMDPTEIYDAPGQSKMGMDLVPVYEDEVSGGGGGDTNVDGVDVTINPVVEQNMGLKVEAVRQGPLSHTIRTFGHITFDETRTGRISPRFDGWVEKLHADFTGMTVKQGDPLFEVYSPALTASQEEFLSARAMYMKQKSRLNKQLYQAARKRLVYYGIAETEIRALEKGGRVLPRILFRSPFSGVVVKKNVVEGGFIKAGADLYSIVDLSVVWVEAHIFEFEQKLVHLGQAVEMQPAYDGDRVFMGKIAHIFPYLQPKTRDVVIRLAFDNADGQLKPDMYAKIRIRSGDDLEGLSIPAQAVIHSGEDQIVFIARGEGRFSPRKITTGLHLEGGRVQVVSGLKAGENVVVSGQFLLDSESKLKEAIQKMMELKSGSPAQAGGMDDDFFDDMDSNDDFFKDME